MALKFDAPVGSTTKVELVGSGKPAVILDSDMNIVVRVTNKNYKLKVTCEKDGAETVIRTLSLKDLNLEPAG